MNGTQNQSASLSTKNQNLGEEPTVSHKDTCSASQAEVVTNLDKWSDEAIARRRELRPVRESKLRLASLSGDNPGLEFLAECWEDVALWNKIKRLIAQYPEWGINCVQANLITIAKC